MYLGRGASAPRRGIGFMRDKHHLRSNLASPDPMPRLRLADEPFHHLADMLDVEARTVECAIRRYRTQSFADGLDTPFPRRFHAFYDEPRRAHADQHAVTAPVKWDCRVFYLLVRSCRAGREEPGADPFHHVIRSRIVSRDHHHAPGS